MPAPFDYLPMQGQNLELAAQSPIASITQGFQQGASIPSYFAQQKAMADQMAYQRQLHQLQMQQELLKIQNAQLENDQLKQKNAPEDINITNQQAFDRARDAGIMSNPQYQSWRFQNADQIPQTKEEARSFGNAPGSYTFGGNPVMNGPLANPDAAVRKLEPDYNVSIQADPRKYELWSQIARKEPTLAEQLQAAKIKADAMKYGADTGAAAKVESARVSANGPRATAMGERVVQAGNNAYDNSLVKNYESRLDASLRIQDLINKMQNGTLKRSPSMAAQLAQDISLLQSNKVTVSGTDHVMPALTGAGQLGNLVHFLSGTTNNYGLSTGDIQQMGIENHALYNELGKQHAGRFDSWIAGQPKSTVSGLTERFNRARKNYGFTGGNDQKTKTSPPSREQMIQDLKSKGFQ